MARNPDPLTLSDLVRRAVEVVDPDGHDPAVSEFELRAEFPPPGFQSDLATRPKNAGLGQSETFS